jgi:hypothetical protein
MALRFSWRIRPLAGAVGLVLLSAGAALLVAPLVLAVSFLVLLVLLRSLVAPVLLLLVNLASAVAAIGAGAWLSRVLFDQQALDLLVALVAQGKERPERVGFGCRRQNLDASDDAVLARRGRKLHAPVLAGLDVDRLGEIDRVDVGRDGDDLESSGRERRENNGRKNSREGKKVTHSGRLYPAVGFIVTLSGTACAPDVAAPCRRPCSYAMHRNRACGPAGRRLW